MADHLPESVPGARVPDWTPATTSENDSVRSAAAPGMSPVDQPTCDLCDDTGYFEWMQMCPDGVLRHMSHPCIHGCGGHWRQPAAEDDLVVDVIDALPIRP